MSGRGGRGRGGRGGRGGGRGPQSASAQYLHNSAQEAGIDVRLIRGATGAGGIFPDLELHSSGERRLNAKESENLRNGGGGGVVGKDGAEQEPPAAEKPRSAGTIRLVSKAREMHHRFQSSVFYVRSTREVPDVVRHSDVLRPPPNVDASAVLQHCLGGKKRTRGEGGGAFVPEELCGGQRRAGEDDEDEGRKRKARGLNLAALARRIRSEGVDGDDEEEFGERGEDEEESDGADYVQNYYESEGDESKGSDGEPTF